MAISHRWRRGWHGSMPIAPWAAAGRVNGSIDARRTPAGVALTGSVSSTLATVAHGERVLARDMRLSIAVADSRVAVREFTGQLLGSPMHLSFDAPLSWLDAALPEAWRIQPAATEAPATMSFGSELDVATALTELGGDTSKGATGRIVVAAQLSAPRPNVAAVSGELRLDRGGGDIGQDDDFTDRDDTPAACRRTAHRRVAALEEPGRGVHRRGGHRSPRRHANGCGAARRFRPQRHGRPSSGPRHRASHRHGRDRADHQRLECFGRRDSSRRHLARPRGSCLPRRLVGTRAVRQGRHRRHRSRWPRERRPGANRGPPAHCRRGRPTREPSRSSRRTSSSTCPGACTVVVLLADGDRTMLSDRGAAARLAPADLPDLKGADHLHLSGYVLLGPASRATGTGGARGGPRGRAEHVGGPAGGARAGTRVRRRRARCRSVAAERRRAGRAGRHRGAARRGGRGRGDGRGPSGAVDRSAAGRGPPIPHPPRSWTRPARATPSTRACSSPGSPEPVRRPRWRQAAPPARRRWAAWAHGRTEAVISDLARNPTNRACCRIGRTLPRASSAITVEACRSSITTSSP